MKNIKLISWFLGISMFMVGFLKFFNPFKLWYTIQIETSGLLPISYAMGVLGELTTGTGFILGLLYLSKISQRRFHFLVIAASSLVIIMMAVGIYVHLHPHVPAEVLPLKIKPPFIPGIFLMLGIYNIYLVKREL